METCSDCSTSIAESSPPDARTPCPQCGSIKRSFSVTAVAHVTASASATGTVIRFHSNIADAASLLMDGDAHPASLAAAIAICGTACEVSLIYALRTFLELREAEISGDTARRVAKALSPKSKVPINMRSEHQRGWWNHLTGDDIAAWPDWNAYKAFLDMRNKVVHTGRINATDLATVADASEALRVTRSLEDHIRLIMNSQSDSAPYA